MSPYRGYQLEDITLVPRPLNRPVDIWQPVTSGRTIDFIARKGIKGMTALSGEKIVEQFFGAYQKAAGEAGRDLQLGQDMALGFGFFLGDTVEEAVERVRPFHDERYKWFAPFGLVRYVDEQGRMWGSPRRTRSHAHRRGRRPAEGLDLRPARGLHRDLPRARGEVPRPRGRRTPVARRYAVARAQQPAGSLLP